MLKDINNIGTTTPSIISQNKNTVYFKSNPLPQDKVEIASKQKELSGVAKVGIGFGIAAAIGLGAEIIWGKGQHLKTMWNKIRGKKIEPPKTYLDNIEKLQEYFNKIFNKNLTKDEANEMALRYQEAFNEEKNVDFLTKIFNNLRKDYDVPINTAQSGHFERESTVGSFGGIRIINDDGTFQRAGWTFNNNLIADNFDRKTLTRNCAHELKHAQQFKIGLQTDKYRYIKESIADNNLNHEWYQEALRNRHGNAELAMNDFIQRLESEVILPEFRNLEPIRQDSPLYQKGKDYVDNFIHYISPNGRNDAEYRNQLIEREAFYAGGTFEKIYEMLKK